MPTNFSALDQNLPRFTGEETTERKVQVIQDYLYQLLEALRYAMNNLDARNFNDAALGEFASGLTDPIYRRLEDGEGNLTRLELTARGLQMQIKSNAGDIHDLSVTATELSSKIADNAGNISALEQRADRLQSQISDANGNISTLTQTAASLQSQITSANGDISTLRQTATSLQSQITSANGNISSLKQTANGLSSTVSSLSGSVSAIRQTVNSISLTVTNGETGSTIALYRDGVMVSSQNIVFNGAVTFADLSGSGRPTTISGGLIDTSTLRVNNLYGQLVYLRDAGGAQVGTMSIGAASSSFAALEISSQGSMRLAGQGGDVYLNSYGGYVTLHGAMGNTCMGNFYPASNGTYSCGIQSFKWNEIYAVTGMVSSSDRREKEEIDYDMSRYSPLFDALRPCSFRRVDGASGRRHTGLIAQEVLEAARGAGLTSRDLAAYCAWDEADAAPASDDAAPAGCGLRYEELIALLIYEVQKLKQISALGRRQADGIAGQPQSG